MDHFSLVLPFVAAASQGGPYEDVAFVAGFECGTIDAALARCPAEIARPVRAASVPQIDLIAMRHDYVCEVVSSDEDWANVVLRPSGRDRSNETASYPCEECGQPNPVWFAPNDVWNLVMGGPEATGDPGGYLCPCCFIRRAEAAGVVPTGWQVAPEAAS